MIGKQVSLVAAGWNHSLVLTDRGDLYACGYGLNGQLGLGDKESKTSFTFVQAFSKKNISKIFAGGNHSWIVLDDVMPTRDNYIR
jgi:alpha-tubulin suppressor-like RCC1 family protein